MQENHTYHEVSSYVWLEDSIKGAFGIRTAVKGEETRNVSHALIVVSSALYLQVVIRFIGCVFFIAWSVKHTAQLHGVIVICGIAGMDNGAV